MRREVPDRVHSQSGDREGWGNCHEQAIRGLPFSRSFEAYILGALDGRRPVVKALWRMRQDAQPGAGRQMFRVCLALLQGEQPAEICKRMRLNDFAFATAALHGLATLRTKAEDSERLHQQNTRVAA